MNPKTILLFCVMLCSITLFSLPAGAGAQGAKAIDTGCGYQFKTFEIRQLQTWGWHCSAEYQAVAERLKKRGFSSKQFVDAFRIYRDIPRLTPTQLEPIAAMDVVDINPKYYYMIDEKERPTPTQTYNAILYKRGRFLTIVGYSVAVAGGILAGIGAWQLARTDGDAVENRLRITESPMGTAFLFTGGAAFIAGMVFGSVGVHKLSLRADGEILDTGNMEALRKRRTKVHHFSPDDFYYDIYNAPTIRRKMKTSGGRYAFIPVVGDGLIGAGMHITF